MFEAYHQVRAEMPWILQVWFFGLGACVGSFLNVCILRIPAGKSIVRPGSHCACGAPIRWHDNIPILSWFILRGRARCCGRKFSIRYALIEAVTAGSFLWLWNTLPARVAVPGMVFFSLLLLGAMVDFDHMELPDVSTIGGLFAGLALSCFFPQMLDAQFVTTGMPVLDGLRGFVLAMIGAVVGAGVVVWIGAVGEFFLKKEAMGYGDVLLMGCIGAFCGWQGALFAIFGGAVLGSIVVLPMTSYKWMRGGKSGERGAGSRERGAGGGERAMVGGEKEMNPKVSADAAEATGGAPAANPGEIPFGPWLALGGFLYYAGLRPWVDGRLDLIREIIFNPPFLQ